MKKIVFVFLIAFCVCFKTYSEQKLLVALHGFLRSTGNFSKFHEEFTKRGWSVFRWSYPSRSKTISELSNDFVDILIEFEKKHPDVEINFVSHSLGGLILRKSVNHPKFPKKYKSSKVVLIAPPNQGSSFGRFLGQYKPMRLLAGKKAGKDLFTKDDFSHLGNFPPSMKVLVIAGTCGFNPLIKGKNDGKVGVSETKLSTPYEYKEVYAGHSWICHSGKTLKYAWDFYQSK